MEEGDFTMQALGCSSPAALLRRVEIDLATWPKMTGEERNAIHRLVTAAYYNFKRHGI